MDVDQTWQEWAIWSDPLEVINCWWWSGSMCGFRITYSFYSPLWNRGLLDIYFHFWYNQRPICAILGKMTDTDKIMHPQHFGTDPTVIQIRINLAIRNGIPDDFWLKFWHWRRSALSECSCCHWSNCRQSRKLPTSFVFVLYFSCSTVSPFHRNIIIMPPTVRKGALSVAFVRLSVCPSVAYILNNSRTQFLACPNLEWRLPTFDATRIPVSRSNGQRSRLEAGGGIPCRPNPVATGHTACLIYFCWLIYL